MMDRNTIALFTPFPREITLKRKICHSLPEFIRYVETTNGKEGVHSSLYSCSLVLDKFWFDFDSYSIRNSFETFMKMYVWLYDRGYKVIPVFSGSKGFHLYIPIQPYYTIQPKEVLAVIQKALIERVFDSQPNELDTHCIGDARKMVRVPNTMHMQTKNYCTYLPPDIKDLSEVLELIKSPHTYEYEGKLMSIWDFADIEKPTQKELSKYEGEGRISPNLIAKAIRPCLSERIATKKPPHFVRVATTVDLLLFFTPSEILNFYSTLNWENFNLRITRYQIESCRKFQPFSCRKIREKLGIDCEKYCGGGS